MLYKIWFSILFYILSVKDVSESTIEGNLDESLRSKLRFREFLSTRLFSKGFGLRCQFIVNNNHVIITIIHENHSTMTNCGLLRTQKKSRYQIDLILWRKNWAHSVKNCHAFNSMHLTLGLDHCIVVKRNFSVKINFFYPTVKSYNTKIF